MACSIVVVELETESIDQTVELNTVILGLIDQEYIG